MAEATALAATPPVDERDWPHTSRVLPWLAALTFVAVTVVPIDSVALPIPLPFDARPDRLLLIASFGMWALIVAVRAPSPQTRLRYRFGTSEVILALFLCAAILSVSFNASELGPLNEAQGAFKKLVLLVSYIGFYVFAVSTIRGSEVPALVRLVVALGTIAALGTIFELITGVNLFFAAASRLSPPGSSVSPATELIRGGRPDVTGPARHGLAITCELAMILPLAVAGAVHEEGRGRRWLFRIAAVILLLGCITTLRRSGVILPFLATSAVILAGGRRMLPLAAMFVVVALAVPLVAPGVGKDVASQFSSSNATTQGSTQGRTQDYPAVIPDLRVRTLLGRGFGTFDPHRYRVLDNQLILSAVETGVIGLATYLALILSTAVIGLRTAWQRAGPASWLGLAMVGSALAFLAANAFFDALSFPQAPYTFLMLLALANVARQDAAGRSAG